MLTLSLGDFSLVVAPGHGGSVLGWTRHREQLLRHPSADAVIEGKPGAMGCFPLVPFCNRIAYRRFGWAGKSYELAANFGDSPHAIHGVGWQRPWRTEQISNTAVTLSLRHDATGDAARAWPFSFAARLTYQLTPAGLTLRIEATNLHTAEAPMGIGAHPWWPRPAGARLGFQAAGVWRTREALPVTHGAVPPEWDHASGRPVDVQALDHCFTGWTGEARLPAVRIDADPIFANLQVYTPAGANFFCVEPVSHVPDAINRPELPEAQRMAVLAPGQTLAGSMTFSPAGESVTVMPGGSK